MNILRKTGFKIGQVLTKLFPLNKDTENLVVKIYFFLQKIKPLLFLFYIPFIIFLTYSLLLFSTPLLVDLVIKFKPENRIEVLSNEIVKDTAKYIQREETRIKQLEKLYEKYTNTQPYLIVNTTENSYKLYNRGKMVREGKCSTGSYILLDAGDEKKWMFETPKGLFRIHGKTESPVWKKPDWAFIEEGLPVPPSYSHLRYEAGVLGDYALSIGNGYLIHGTLYKRLLGMPVTHGCVRMDDPDLEAVYNTLGIGSKVYIF